MRFLLDTHAFLWFTAGDERLGGSAVDMIGNPENEVLLSVASLWEIAIKLGTGKLKLDFSFDALLEDKVVGNGFRLLLLEPSHLRSLLDLPLHHRDPFDRLLIAQAIAENLPILTEDGAFAAYAVRLLSA